MASIAFLGTGLIGGAMARAASERGDDVIAWNRTRERAEPLTEYGVEVVDTPAEAIKGAARAHLAFPHDEVVDDVLALCAEAIDSTTVLVDHTTTSPVKTAARAERLAKAGFQYLHAPVFMSPAACLKATGMMLLSGPEETYEAVASDLEEMTGRLRYLGPDMRRAAAFKLFGNAMLVSLIGGLADVFAMASELDIEARDALSLFEDFNPAGVLDYRGKNMAEGNYDPSFELTMARKDVRLMLEAAGDSPLAVLTGLSERMDELIAEGHGDADVGILSYDSVPPKD